MIKSPIALIVLKALIVLSLSGFFAHNVFAVCSDGTWARRALEGTYTLYSTGPKEHRQDDAYHLQRCFDQVDLSAGWEYGTAEEQGYCQSVIGEEYVFLQDAVITHNYICITYPPDFVLQVNQPNPSCNKQGNPCDVITGRKTETTEDLALKNIQLFRSYDSGATNPSEFVGRFWRHNFDTEMSFSIRPPLTQQNISSVYSQKWRVCSDGWGELRHIAFRGKYSSSGTAYLEDNKCKLYSHRKNRGGVYISDIPVLEIIITPPPINTIYVSRPSGAFYTFHEISSGQYEESNGYDVRLVKQADQDFLFYDTDGSIDRFLNNQMIERTLADGKVLTISYNEDGHVESVSDTFGESLEFAYDTNDQVQSVSYTGGQIQYAYDANYNLSTVTYEDGSTRQYHYENTDFPHHLTGITDERGIRYATWTYDDQGRATSSSHAGGADLTTLEYQETSTIVTDPTGAVREYHLEMQNGQLVVSHITGTPCKDCWKGDAKDRQYDANGHLSQVTDWNGNITTYIHNTQGQEISRTEAFGTPEARTIETEWHPVLNLPIKIIEPERETVTTYDDKGRVLSRQVNLRSY